MIFVSAKLFGKFSWHIRFPTRSCVRVSNQERSQTYHRLVHVANAPYFFFNWKRQNNDRNQSYMAPVIGVYENQFSRCKSGVCYYLIGHDIAFHFKYYIQKGRKETFSFLLPPRINFAPFKIQSRSNNNDSDQNTVSKVSIFFLSLNVINVPTTSHAFIRWPGHVEKP